MKGTFYLILTGFFLATTGIWVKLIGTSISPFLLTIFRTLIAAALIFAMVVISRNMKTVETLKIKKRDALLMLVIAFFGVTIGLGFYVKSFSYVPVANSVMLVYVYPVIVTLLSWPLLKERITRWELTALVLILLGIWTIYGSEINIAADVLGNTFALLAGLGYAVFIVSMRFFEEKGYKYWNVTFWPLLLGGLLLVLLMPFEPFTFSPSGMMPLYVLGLAMVTFLGYICYAEGLKTVRALDAVIITALTEPLSAMVLAFLILGEAIPQSVLAGGALIIAANILVSREHRKKRIRRCKEKKPQECFGWTW